MTTRPIGAAADAAAVPPRWTWCDHAHGTPAEPLVRAWLAETLQVPAADIRLERDRHGRPRLGGALGGFDVSWSHSGEGLLVALGEGIDLGVDLERARIRPRAHELAERIFHAYQHRWLRDHHRLRQQFLRRRLGQRQR